MRRTPAILALAFVAACAAPPAAGAQDEAPDWEIFGGYSFTHWGSGSVLLPQQNTNGWDISGGENVNHWLGGIADISGTYASRTIQGLRINGSAYPFLFGPQFTLRQLNRIHLFGRPLIGGVHAHDNLSGGTALVSQTKWAYSLGGGADFRLNRHASVRLSADWIRSHFPQTLARDYQNSVRVSAGFVFALGTARNQ
jgi:hypothetical protein